MSAWVRRRLFNCPCRAQGSALTVRGVAIMAAVMFLASACQPTIQVVNRPAPAMTVVPAQHALAIIGVDFDPPLASLQITTAGKVRLLVAIENQGQFRESAIGLSARLADPNDRDATSALLNETIVVESLEPGEMRIVPFSPVTSLPVRGRYKLVVELAGAPAELELGDNKRIYDILVSGAD